MNIYVIFMRITYQITTHAYLVQEVLYLCVPSFEQPAVWVSQARECFLHVVRADGAASIEQNPAQFGCVCFSCSHQTESMVVACFRKNCLITELLC